MIAIAAVAVTVVVLADHGGARRGRVVIELVLELLLDHGPFFLDHQHLAQAVREFAHAVRLQRPHHADLVQADAEGAAGGIVQPQVQQRLARVAVGLAAGDDAQAVIGTLDHIAVEAVGAHIGQRRRPLELHHARLGRERVVGPADMQAALGLHEILRQHDAHAVGVGDHRGARFHHFLHCLHARPQPAEAAHGKGMHAQVKDVLHVRREEHRQPARHEGVVALVCQRAALGHVVVAGQRDHAAQRRGAGQVGVLERVAAAVHAGALAVPDAEHAIELLAGGIELQLLRAPHRRDTEFFIDAGLEHHVAGSQVPARLPQRLVVAAQRRAAIAGDKAGGMVAGGGIAPALQQRQAHQRLHAAHIGAAGLQRVLVIDRHSGQGLAGRIGGYGGIHVVVFSGKQG
ncbi:hypothetical protein FQZ97_588070 [compost metagenome]